MTEISRQSETVDFMLSAHSTLRDRYRCRRIVFNIGVIGMSLILSVLAVVEDAVLEAIGGEPGTVRLFLGMPTIALLVISFSASLVDLRGRAQAHGRAARILANLKTDYRTITSIDRLSEDVERDLTTAYHKAMQQLVSIPETQFNQLKARHRFKRLLSRATDNTPGAPVWLLCVVLRTKGIWAAITNNSGEKPDAE